MAVLAALAVALFAVIQYASAAPVLTITLDDSDNVVAAGSGYTVNVTVKDAALAAADQDVSDDYTLEYITVTGGVFLANIITDGNLLENTHDDNNDATLVVPLGAEGVYTITAGVIDPDGNTATDPDSAVRVVGTLEVTVGDVGTPIGSAEIVLGKVDDQGAHSAAATATADKAQKRFGEDIAVTVNVLNSLGNKPNATEVNTVLIFAPAATVGEAANQQTANSADADMPGVSNNFYVSKAAAGTVDVYAVAIGTGGTATSSTLTLTFTGDADTIALGDVSSPLPANSVTALPEADPVVVASGFATLKVTAVDGSGNKANLEVGADDLVPGLTVAFTDADDNGITTITPAYSQAPPAGATDCNDTADDGIPACDTTTVLVTLTTIKAVPGEYTMSATFGQKEAVTTTVVVSGAPANIELSSTHETVGLGNIVTVTASVTDKDGNAVTNERSVIFTAVGALKLTALDDVEQSTKHGEAKIRYVVVDGSGTATIIAASDDADAVIAMSTDAGEAAAPEAVSLDCLSATNGFASYTCGVDSSASELFGLVSGRGATAVHLWNGSDWVRYSVVDGAMVPGSSDFTVTEDDILYISN